MMKNVGNSVKSYLLLLCFIFGIFLLNGFCQDQIYTLDGRTIPCKVGSIDKKISYKIYSNPNGPEYFIKSKDIGFIVYENGDIQAFNKKKRRYLTFVHPNYDLLLLAERKLLPIDSPEILSGEVKGVSLAQASHPKLNFTRNSVLAFWNREKGFLAFGSHDAIRDALMAVNLPKDIYPLKNPSSPNSNSSNSLEGVFTTDVTVDTSDEEAPAFQKTSVLDIDEEEFKEKAVAKVGRLTRYISLIADKDTPRPRADRAINETLVLFVSDTCIVQISSIKKPDAKPREEFIRRYLQNLKQLLYDRVEIEWAEINYVSDLKKDPSGNYWGMVSFLQRFKGFRDGKVAYSDKVTKNVKVWFKSYEKFENGVGEELWDVLLSDIMVEQTEVY